MLRRHIAQCTLPVGYARLLTITPIPMPALSPTMEKGKISEWVKKVGDPVETGDAWCKVETDKAVVSYDNVSEEGFVARILVQVGEEATVGDAVCLIVDEASGLNSDEVKNWRAGGGEPAAQQPRAQEVSPPTEGERASVHRTGSDERVKASPLARKTAQELNMPLDSIKGTGGGVCRIVKKDVEAAALKRGAPSSASTPVPRATLPVGPVAVSVGNYVDIPVTNMRSTIAKRLTQSKNLEIPHYYLFEECCAENMMSLVQQLNSKGDGKYKITLNDYIIKAVARANMLVPEANSSWQGDFIRQYRTVDVSVAVATPTGLITPIIKDAQSRGLVDISNEMKALAKKAREGTLQPHEFVGGTVSVSNLGASGIPGFTAIINPPQALIVAVGSAKPRPRMILDPETGKYAVGSEAEMFVRFTASFDHRVVDGAVASQWCKHFKDAVENPLSLLL